MKNKYIIGYVILLSLFYIFIMTINSEYWFDVLILLLFIAAYPIIVSKFIFASEKYGEMLKSDSQKTMRRFNYEGDLWTIVDQWAEEAGFKMIKEENQKNNVTRWYKKRGLIYFLLNDFAMLQITHSDDIVNLYAWIHLSIFKRPYFFVRKENMKLESDASLPVWFFVRLRPIARRNINKLLTKFSQSLIK